MCTEKYWYWHWNYVSWPLWIFGASFVRSVALRSPPGECHWTSIICHWFEIRCLKIFGEAWKRLRFHAERMKSPGFLGRFSEILRGIKPSTRWDHKTMKWRSMPAVKPIQYEWYYIFFLCVCVKIGCFFSVILEKASRASLAPSPSIIIITIFFISYCCF